MTQLSSSLEGRGEIAPFGPTRDDFESIEAAVMETERGRWFLREFSRRHHEEETSRVLAAIERLEARTIQIAAAEARARVEAQRAGRVLREIAGVLRHWRPRAALGRNSGIADAAGDTAGALETRLAVLAGLDSLEVETRLKLFG